MSSSNKHSPEVRERAVRMVLEHQSAHDSQWAAMGSIAEKIGCTSETLRKWVRQAERDQGRRPGLTSAERERLKALERENRELRRAGDAGHLCVCEPGQNLSVQVVAVDVVRSRFPHSRVAPEHGLGDGCQATPSLAH